MRKFLNAKSVIRPVLVSALLGLAACGATPNVDTVSRIEQSALAPTAALVEQAATLKAERRAAKNKTFAEQLSLQADELLAGSGYDVELEVESFMVPDAMQAKITGAQAYVAAKITLKNALTGDVLVDSADVTFVAPSAAQNPADADALVLAFGAHLTSSLQVR